MVSGQQTHRTIRGEISGGRRATATVTGNSLSSSAQEVLDLIDHLGRSRGSIVVPHPRGGVSYHELSFGHCLVGESKSRHLLHLGEIRSNSRTRWVI
jgi:hypothetical protein